MSTKMGIKRGRFRVHAPIPSSRLSPQGVSPHTRQGPGRSPQIRENNPLDFSTVLVISGCNMQFRREIFLMIGVEPKLKASESNFSLLLVLRQFALK